MIKTFAKPIFIPFQIYTHAIEDKNCSTFSSKICFLCATILSHLFFYAHSAMRVGKENLFYFFLNFMNELKVKRVKEERITSAISLLLLFSSLHNQIIYSTLACEFVKRGNEIVERYVHVCTSMCVGISGEFSFFFWRPIKKDFFLTLWSKFGSEKFQGLGDGN